MAVEVVFVFRCDAVACSAEARKSVAAEVAHRPPAPQGWWHAYLTEHQGDERRFLLCPRHAREVSGLLRWEVAGAGPVDG